MRKSESVKKPKRVRVGSLFTLETDAKSELKRRAKASGVPMSRILDSLVLNRDRLSDEAERVLTQYCADHGISRAEALVLAVERLRDDSGTQ